MAILKELESALKNSVKFNIQRNISDADFSVNEDDYWTFDTGGTSLHRAATLNNNYESIRVLIDQGLDVNARL